MLGKHARFGDAEIASCSEIMSVLFSFESVVQVKSAWHQFEQGSVAHFIARVLICIFFLDCGLERYQNWKFYQTDFMKQRVSDYPHRYRDPGITQAMDLTELFWSCSLLLYLQFD